MQAVNLLSRSLGGFVPKEYQGVVGVATIGAYLGYFLWGLVVGQFHRKRSERQILQARLTKELRLRKLLISSLDQEEKKHQENERTRDGESAPSPRLEELRQALKVVEDNSVLSKFVKEWQVHEEEEELGADGKVPFGAFSIVFLLAWAGAFLSVTLPMIDHLDHIRQHLLQLMVWPVSAAVLTLILFAMRLNTMGNLLKRRLKGVWVFAIVGAVVMYGVLAVTLVLFPEHVEHGDVFGLDIDIFEHSDNHTHDEL